MPDETSKTKKHSEIIAEKIVDWLVEKNLDKTLLAIGGDSTNVNTGWEGGCHALGGGEAGQKTGVDCM